MIAVANCYSEIGRPIMTKRYLLKALSTRGIGGKEKEVITYNLGNAYFDLKKYEFAIQEYKKIKKSKSEVYRLARKNIDYINNQKRQLIG